MIDTLFGVTAVTKPRARNVLRFLRPVVRYTVKPFGSAGILLLLFPLFSCVNADAQQRSGEGRGGGRGGGGEGGEGEGGGGGGGGRALFAIRNTRREDYRSQETSLALIFRL